MNLFRATEADIAARYADEASLGRARLQLTGWYTLTLAFIVALFSVALYFALASQLAQHGQNQPDSVPREVERETADFALSRLRLFLVGGNLLFLTGAAGGAYLLAGRTLEPVAQAMKRQRRFSADASHELRTPLTVMRGTIDVALQRERSSETYRQTLADLREEVVSMTGLVERLLLLARGHSRPAQPSATSDVQEVLQDVVKSSAGLASAHRSTVRLVPAPPLIAMAERGEVRQVLLNLVMNALQHTPAGTNVALEARQRGHDAEVTVSDDGPGIPTGQRANIFEPFFRVETTGADGSGLGLALCREIVSANGGSLSLDEADSGATFRVRLPLASGSALRGDSPTHPANL